MSEHHEQLSSQPSMEQNHKHEVEPSHEAAERHTESAKDKFEKEANQLEELEIIKNKVEEAAKSGKEVRVEHVPKAKQTHMVTKELKDEALKRRLQRTRKQLSKPERALSKAIHQPVVDFASKVGEKTIARPTGVLTGAIVALAGSSYLLYSAKHYGYNYNYFVVVILFVGGYAVGLILELLWSGLRRLRGAK